MELRSFLQQPGLPNPGKWTKPVPTFTRSSRAAPRKPRPAPFVSIIIPAHNEEAYLPHTLKVLNRQNYRSFEVIVVANGCTDRTTEVARGLCHRLVGLSTKALGTARNLGARLARGELLVFLDADTTLEPMALRQIVRNFCEADAAATLKGRPSSDRPAYRLVYGLKNFVHRCALHPGSSGVIICWKKHFMAVGGFDEALEVRENSELIKRLRWFGHYKYIGDTCATTSMRRFERRGFRRVTWLWLRLWVQSVFGDLHQRRYETVR